MLSSKKYPFFLSLDNNLLQLVGGSFAKERFKVESFAFAKVSLDSFQNGEIINPQVMAEMINSLLANSQPKRIKNSFCRLVLADEVVFSKFLTLPHVKEEEVEEAVYFKIKDFLPHPPQEMYLDWQLLVNGQEQREVNVLAVRREIIDSYLKTLALVDIFPLGFESESCSLARLAALGSAEPSLVIYFSGQKATLCFQEKGLILLTTTFSFSFIQDDTQLLLPELAKSTKFWRANLGRKKTIKNIYLAGMIKDELVLKQAIKNNFSAPVSHLPLPIIIPPELPQERLAKLTPLLGLAFSQKETQSKQKKVLLIPEAVKQERKKFEFKKGVKNLLKINSLILWAFIALYSFVFLSIFFQLNQVKATLSGMEKIIFTPNQVGLEKKAIDFNQKLLSLDQALQKREKVSSTLVDFIDRLPAGITILQFTFEPAKNLIEISGQANTRENILTLEKEFSKLGQVIIPLSSFEESQGPKFRASIKLQEQK